VDAFLDGVISRDERGQRLAAIDRDIRSSEEILRRQCRAAHLESLSAIEVLAPLVEWPHWSRDQKRQILSAIMDIRVADYRVDSIGFAPEIFGNEDAHTGRGSWPPPA